MFPMPQGIPQLTVISHTVNHNNVIKPQSSLNSYKTALKMKTPPYYTSFNLNVTLDIFPYEAIDPVLNNKQ